MKSINLTFVISSLIFVSIITLVIYNSIQFGIQLPYDLY